MANNAAFAKKYPVDSIPKMVDMRARSKSSGQGLIVLTCLDPRTVPEQFFGPDLRAGVVRNAGGRAGPDAITSIVTLRTLMDTKNIAVVHHTGTLRFHARLPKAWLTSVFRLRRNAYHE